MSTERGSIHGPSSARPLNLPHRASLGISSTRKLNRCLVFAEGQPRVGDFLRLGNDAIQPLETSASKLLICNERNFGACGLQDFDARRGREEGAEESGIGPGTGNPARWRSPQTPAEIPANPQDPAMKKANRERLAFVNWWRRRESNTSPQQGLRIHFYMLIPVFAFNRLLTGSLRISKIQ